MVKITGRDGTFSVKNLLGADVKHGTDIRMESGSSLPVSRAARNAMFMDMMNRGALPPDVALKLMKLPNMKAYFDRVEVDQQQARRENQKIRELTAEQIGEATEQAEMMKQELLMKFQMTEDMLLASPVGSQIQAMFEQPIIAVNEFDDHEAHIAEHSYYMKSQSYESLPKETQQQFLRHYQAHKDAQYKQQFEEIMKSGMGMTGDQVGMEMAAQGGEAPTDPSAEQNAEAGNQFQNLPQAGAEQPA